MGFFKTKLFASIDDGTRQQQAIHSGPTNNSALASKFHARALCSNCISLGKNYHGQSIWLTVSQLQRSERKGCPFCHALLNGFSKLREELGAGLSPSGNLRIRLFQSTSSFCNIMLTTPNSQRSAELAIFKTTGSRQSG